MSKNVNEKNASLCFLCNKCEKKRKSKANISITYLLMSCILLVNVQTQTLSSPVGNLTSPYTFSSGFPPSIGVGPETSHMVAHTVIASSSSYEVFYVCACIW